jgi:hypothetical protein
MRVIVALTLAVMYLANASGTVGAQAQAAVPQSGATAETAQPTPALTSAGAPGERAFAQSAVNTVIFDHYNLQPGQSDPLVLRLSDGDYFQVRTVNTDPTKFSYKISAVPDEETPITTTGVAGIGVAARRFAETAVTMRHSEAFARYRLTISLRADLTQALAPRISGRPAGGVRDMPELLLFPAVFDGWVQTKPGFEVSFTGGVAFSGFAYPIFHQNGRSRHSRCGRRCENGRGGRDCEGQFRPDSAAVGPGKVGG